MVSETEWTASVAKDVGARGNTGVVPQMNVTPLVDVVLQLNGSTVGFEELPERLRRVFAARSDHIIFFDADDRAAYGFVVQVMDQAREGGGVTIAALTEPLTQPPPTSN